MASAPSNSITAEQILSAVERLTPAQLAECKTTAIAHGRPFREQVAQNLAFYLSLPQPIDREPQKKKIKLKHDDNSPQILVSSIVNHSDRAKFFGQEEHANIKQEDSGPLNEQSPPAPPSFASECCSAKAPCPKIWKCNQTSKKYYGVRRGRKLGIYYYWPGPGGAQEQVNGFSRPFQRSFYSQEEVENFMNRPSVAGCFEERHAGSSPQSPLAIFVPGKTLPLATSKFLPRRRLHIRETTTLLLRNSRTAVSDAAPPGPADPLVSFVLFAPLWAAAKMLKA